MNSFPFLPCMPRLKRSSYGLCISLRARCLSPIQIHHSTSRDLSLFHQWVTVHSYSFHVLWQTLQSKEEQIQVVVTLSPTLLQLFWSLTAFIWHLVTGKFKHRFMSKVPALHHCGCFTEPSDNPPAFSPSWCCCHQDPLYVPVNQAVAA